MRGAARRSAPAGLVSCAQALLVVAALSGCAAAGRPASADATAADNATARSSASPGRSAAVGGTALESAAAQPAARDAKTADPVVAAGGAQAGQGVDADTDASASAEPGTFTRIRTTVEGPKAARELVKGALAGVEAGAPPRDAFERQRVVRQVRRVASEALATEGWFSPGLDIRDDGARVSVTIEPGVRTTIADVDIEFRGAIADEAGRERRESLRRQWALDRGEPFRQEEWDASKRRLLNGLLARDFAAGRIVDSTAEIDADAARARLRVVLDSGPRFTFGTLLIEGLSTYDRALVERYARIQPGDPYSTEALLNLQTSLQNTPYFSGVTVEASRDPDRAVRVPVAIRVTEALPKRAGFGIGFSSNTGARGEATYSNADFFGRAWALESGVRIEQRRQLGFATVRLPPNRDDSRDSFTLLGERSDIQNLVLRRIEASAARSRIRGRIETRYSLNLQREWRQIPGEDLRAFKALTANWSWTWRGVDDIVDPRRGLLINAQLGAGTKALLSDQNFVRAYLRAQRYWTVRQRDVFSLRGILGATFAPSRDGIPQSFLFRTGGSTTVRGYAFESLGLQQGGAVVGGRYTASLGAEYVNWFAEKWGVAYFVDAGNAVDRVSDLRLKLGYGVGARFRSPVGPLALDVAYGQDVRRLRLHVAIAVAF